MKFERTDTFHADYQSLPEEHRVIVRQSLPTFLAAADALARSGLERHSWPGAFRVHAVHGAPGIYAVTFNLRRPDVRATFEWSSTAEGEPVLRWRRMGSHAIYTNP